MDKVTPLDLKDLDHDYTPKPRQSIRKLMPSRPRHLIQRRLSRRMFKLLRALGFEFTSHQNSLQIVHIEDRLRECLTAYARHSKANETKLRLFTLLYKDDALDELAEKVAIRAALKQGNSDLAAYLERNREEYMLKDYLVPESFELRFILETHAIRANHEAMARVDQRLLLHLQQYYTFFFGDETEASRTRGVRVSEKADGVQANAES